MSADQSRIGRSNVSRSKAHERRIAHLLTDWSGVPFRRRRVEGRDTAVRVVELVADVIPCVGDFHFSIEAKCGRDFSLDGLMATPLVSCFTGWWHQACYDAQLVSGDLGRTVLPMMFFKPHPNWDWVAFSASAINLLCPKLSSHSDPDGAPANVVPGGAGKLWFPHLLFDAFAWLGEISGNVSHSKKHKKLVKLQLDAVVICRWRDFATSVMPESAFVKFPSAAVLASVGAGAVEG